MIVNIILICGKCRGKQKYKGYNLSSTYKCNFLGADNKQ